MENKPPKFQKCLDLMKKHDPQLQEDGFFMLKPFASLFVEELINAFSNETDHGLKCWLLELIGESHSPLAFQLLKKNIESTDESFKIWAKIGLKKLSTKEAKKVLFDSRQN